MIQIFDQELEALAVESSRKYDHENIVIWGAGSTGNECYNMLASMGANVVAYCDSNDELWGSKMNDCIVISPKQLQERICKGEDILVQIAAYSSQGDEIAKQLEQFNLYNYADFKRDIALAYYSKMRAYARRKACDVGEVFVQNAWKSATEKKQLVEQYIGEDRVLLCMPPKTGDITLNHTFARYRIPFYNTLHIPEAFDRTLLANANRRVKIITAVREPMGQMISYLYQIISTMSANFTRRYAEELFVDGGDVQKLFDKWSKDQMLGDYGTSIVGKFFNRFADNLLDVMNVPFDKEKGYTIVKEDHVEVFIYTLERINEVIPALSEFVGVPFSEFVKANDATDKWIGNSYKRAQQELKVTQEFFDACYSEPYVEHFYTESEIEQFKAKWVKNVKI